MNSLQRYSTLVSDPKLKVVDIDALLSCYLRFLALVFHNFSRQMYGIISAQQVATMKLPQFPSRRNSQKPNKQDDEVFAEASELAMLRLEQCMADLGISAPEIKGPVEPRGLHPLRRVTNPF